jgi:hypothetical protein
VAQPDLARRVDAPVEVVPHPHCYGHRWAVDPDSRTVYYLADLPAGDAADAVIAAVAALRTHDGRATLRLVPAARAAS